MASEDAGRPEATIQDLLNSHRQLMEAEFERISLERERLREEQKRAEAERRRAASVEQLLSQVGNLIERVDNLTKMLSTLVNQYPVAESIRELADEVRNGISRIEDNVQLVLAVNQFVLPYIPTPRGGERERLASQIQHAMLQPHIQSLQRKISIQQRSLDLYEEKAAAFGINVPVEISMGIETTRAKIAELQRELDECCGE